MVEIHLNLVIFLSQVAVLLIEVLVGFFEVVDGGLHALQLLFERVDLLVLFHCQFFQDAYLLLALLVLLEAAVLAYWWFGVCEGNEVFDLFGGEGDELLEGFFEAFVPVSQGEGLSGFCCLALHLTVFDLQFC